jgi:hypothetical protein
MNAYTTMGQARIEQRDISTIVRMHGFSPGAQLAALERQRGWQAEAELDWLLDKNGRNPHTAASLASILRQTIGTALVQAGERLAGNAGRGVSPATPGTARALMTT